MNVLVTGSSRGIGRAIAVHLARPGGRVVVNYLQNQEEADRTAQLVSERGAEPVVIQGDVRSEADLKRLADGAGVLDVLVHNAAVGALKPALEMRTSHWDLTLESSLRPFWLLTRLARLSDGASVIGVSSLGSRRFIPDYCAMGAAKAGMEALTRQLAVELAERGIRVNTVCGGLVETDALRYFPHGEQMSLRAAEATPLGRLGQPEDLARVVGLLVSPDAGWITGQVLVADGGLSLR
ncbi:MAG: SDR family oxidoreductase [Myxococcota bacterium]|nr:SDR family oxidoreductase [Myxococcota bacterium]